MLNTFDSVLASSDLSLERVLNTRLPVALIFYDRQLPPDLRQRMDDLARQSAGKALIVMLERSDAAQAAARFGVRQFPSLVTVRDGKALTSVESVWEMHEELFASFGKDYENTLPGPNVKIKTTYATLAVRPALAYGLTKKLQLELQLVDLLSIGYTRRTPTGDESESVVKRSSFYASTGLTSAPLASFGLGMSLLF